MSKHRFESILQLLAYTSHIPAHQDRFWEVCEMLDEFNNNMSNEFLPS